MARQLKKTIITCAITGGIHTPTMSDALPYKPEDIAQQALDAAAAGAAIVHLHARDPQDGRPRSDPELFRQILEPIKAGSDAIMNITTGGGLGMTLDERLAAATTFAPEMSSLNLGSMNFALHPLADRYTEWKFDWEQEFLRRSAGNIFANTFSDIRYISEKLGKGLGVRFELECYDVGHLYNLAHVVDSGWIEPPFFIQTIFGVLGGIGPNPENLLYMKRTADKLFGDEYVWSVLAAGRHQIPLTTQAALAGGNVRVGLEDNLYIGKGDLASSNAQLVSKIRTVLEELGMEIATSDEVRQILKLKGKDQVAV